MFKKITPFILVLVAIMIAATGCKKEEYAFGDLKAPTDLTLTTEIIGVSAATPDGDGSGSVKITATSKNALTYNIDFGDGVTRVVPAGTLMYKFTTSGTTTYTITVNAIGTGGSISTISKQVKVFVAFEIPPAIVAAFTDGASKVWVTDKNALGHFGVGPTDAAAFPITALFTPFWYEATPNTREACAYDDEITFTKTGNTISMSVNNKGTSFSTAAATGFYGFIGGDGCYAINTGGTKVLAFSDATSGSTSAVSTKIQFRVPGNGIINFGTGGTTYEIISYTANTMFIRNVGTDGNAWYQKLIKK